MAYQKTIWVNGQAPALNAINLNKIETGIESADFDVNNLYGRNAQNTVLTYTGADLTNVKEYWPDGTTIKTDVTLTYTSGDLTQVVTVQRDPQGITIKTITEALGYSGGNLVSVTRSVS